MTSNFTKLLIVTAIFFGLASYSVLRNKDSNLFSERGNTFIENLPSKLNDIQKIKITGIELSLEQIKKAKEKNLYKNLNFIHGDILNYKSKDLKFKTIILSNVLEHIKNRVLFLKKELLRSKNKLGQIISQKKLIEEKIKISFLEELKVKEEKLLTTTPLYRKI